MRTRIRKMSRGDASRAASFLHDLLFFRVRDIFGSRNAAFSFWGDRQRGVGWSSSGIFQAFFNQHFFMRAANLCEGHDLISPSHFCMQRRKDRRREYCRERQATNRPRSRYLHSPRDGAHQAYCGDARSPGRSAGERILPSTVLSDRRQF